MVSLKEENEEMKKRLDGYRQRDEFNEKVASFFWLTMITVMYFVAVTIITHYAIVGGSMISDIGGDPLGIHFASVMIAYLILSGIGFIFSLLWFIDIFEAEIRGMLRWLVKSLKRLFARIDEDMNDIDEDMNDLDIIDEKKLVKTIKGSLESFDKPAVSVQPRDNKGRFARKEAGGEKVV